MVSYDIPLLVPIERFSHVRLSLGSYYERMAHFRREAMRA